MVKGARFVAAVLTALTACSHGDADERQAVAADERSIVFAGQTQDGVAITRAALSDAATSFRVWAYKNTAYDETDGYTACQTVIDGYTVSWSNTLSSSNTAGWEYVNGSTQTIKYWDFNALAYRFFGYAPATAAVGVAESADKIILTVPVDGRSADAVAAAPYISEPWFSTGNPTDYPDRLFAQPVRMSFFKPFARVRFLFTFADGLTIDRSDLSDVSFHPFNLSAQIGLAGNVSFAYPLKGKDTTYSWTSTVTDGIPAFTDDYQEVWQTVLPAEEQGAYELTVTVGSEDRSATVPAVMMQWLPGYDYTYVFKITEDGAVTLSTLRINLSIAQDWQKGNYNYTEIGN